MLGDLNPQKIAQDSFNDFKKGLDTTIDVAPEYKASIDKSQNLEQRESQIKSKVASLSARGSESAYAFGKPFEYSPEKLSWTERNYDIDQLYTKLSDGTYYKNFETYTPGINNYEDKARKQGTGERWLNLGTKFLDTALTGIVGGTIGTIYSIPTAIKEGRLSALYDNDFMRDLDLHQEKMAIDYKQYVTAEDKKDFFNWELGDEIAQGVAFTVGAIATDALWAFATGGVSLEASGARWAMKLGKIADKVSDASRYLKDTLKVAKLGKAEAVVKPFLATNRTLQKFATAGGTIGKGSNVLRSMLTGAGYEAGFEARAYKNEARRDFKEQFKAKNGVEPTAEEMKQFEDNLDSTANGLFAFNLAVVGSSHLAQFGNLANIKLPKTGITNAINKKLFGIGTEIIENAPKALVASRKQKIAQIGWSLGKGAVVEGFYEEGLQSVGNNTANTLIKQTYDPDLAKENYSLVEATMKGFAQTYGTKDGLHEVAVGMLVGALTGNALGIASKKTLAHEFADANKRNQAIEENFGKNSNYSSQTTIENLIMSNRVLANKKAENIANKKGDFLGGQLARSGSLFAQFQRGKNLDFLDEQTEMLSKSIDLIDVNDLAKEQGVSVEQAQDIKDSMKVELINEKKRFERLNTFSNYFISSRVNEAEYKEYSDKISKEHFTGLMKEALTYELYMGEVSYEHADEMLGAYKNEVQNLLGSDEVIKAIDIHDAVNRSKKSTQRELSSNKKELETTSNELTNLEKEIRNLENVVSNASTPEQRQASLSSLNSLTSKREELTNKITELTDKFNVLKKSAKLESKFGQNTPYEELSTEEILSLNSDIEQVDEALKQLDTSDPEKALRLKKLLKEYEKSVLAYKKYTERTNQMMGLGQGLRGGRNILAKLIFDSNPNQATKDMIKGLFDTHYEKGDAQKKGVDEAINNIKLEQESKEEGVSMNPNNLDNLNDKIAELNKERNLELSKVSPLSIDILDKDAISNVLSDNKYYITHVTSDNNAVNIYNSSLNMSAGVSSTTGIVTKQGLIDLINNLEKGISPHRGYLDLFIGSIGKTILDNNKGKTLQDKLENYLEENSIEDVDKTQLPSSLNFGYYTNRNLYIKDESIKTDNESINKKIKLYEGAINKLKKKLENEEIDTDIEVDAFAKEMNNDILEYQKVSFQNNDAIIYQTSQNNSWSGIGSSFRKTWDVLKFNQSFANNPVYAHVRILLTPEQKANYDKNSKSGFSKDLRDLAKKYRGDNVVLIDVRPDRGSNNKKSIESNINSKLKEIDILKNKLNISENTKKINIFKQENTLNKEEINKINFNYDEKIAKLTGRNNLLSYIKQTIKDNPYLFEQIGDNVEETLPTDEELIEYIELYSPVLEDPNFDNTNFEYIDSSTKEVSKKENLDKSIKLEEVLTENQKNNLDKAKKNEKAEPSKVLFNSVDDLVRHSEFLLGKTFNVKGLTIKFVDYKGQVLTGAGQRVFVKVLINEVPVTFYSSTGSGGKSLQEGIFYPTLGIESDDRFNGTWINKIDGVEMASYYNSAVLAIVGDFLDTQFGNTNPYIGEINQNTLNLQNPNKEALTKEKALEIRKEFNGEYLNSNRETYSNNERNKVVNAFKNLVNELNSAVGETGDQSLTLSSNKVLNTEEINRLKQLNTKFANWQLIDSVSYEGVTLAELIQQEALSRQEVSEVEQVEDVNDTVLDSATKEVDEKGERRFDIIQTVENAFIVDNKAKTHKLISHLTPKKFFELMGEKGKLEVVYFDSEGKQIDKPVKTTVDKVNEVVKPNSKIYFGNTFIEITQGMRIKYRNDLNVKLDSVATKSGYSLLFNSDGTVMLSDFSDVDKYSPKEIMALKTGDELELRVEDNDFNLSLSEDNMLDNLKITIFKDGNRLGDLKANYGEGEKSEFLKIRQKAKNIFTDTDSQTVGFIRVKNVFLGAPNIRANNEMFDVDKNVVKDYGYWDGEKLNLVNKSKPRTDLIKDVKTSTPIIVVEENGMPVAYPVTLEKQNKNLGTEILNKGLNKGQLVLELNKALKENGIKTNLYYISDENTNMFELDGKTSALLEDYVKKLDSIQDTADYTGNWLENNTAKANIDFSGNRFFLSPKLAINLETFREVSDVQTQEKVSDDVLKLYNYKNDIVKLGNKKQLTSLNKQAIKINDDTLKLEGSVKKFIQEGDNIYVYSETNKSHVKWVNDYKAGFTQALDLIKSKFTKYKEADIFRDYNKIQDEVNKLESDFLTKIEYEDYLTQLKRKEDSEEGKKC